MQSRRAISYPKDFSSRPLPSEAATPDFPTALISVLGIAAILALPFFRFRPNRIAEGTAVYLLMQSPWAAALILALWVASLLGSTVRSRVVGPVFPLLISCVSFLAAGAGCRHLATGPIARVSVSAGFWVTLMLCYLLFVTISGRMESHVLRRALSASVPILLAILLVTGYLNQVSVVREYTTQKATFVAETETHAALSGIAVAGGTLFGILFGVLARRSSVLRQVGFFILNILQTIPSLALFGFMILPLAALAHRFPVLTRLGISGIGPAPALLALAVYATFPVARNTYTALAGISSALTEAGRGMGMTRLQLLLRVEAPVAAPVILGGVRTSAVQAVGNTVVTALIGAGGLGAFIFQGLGQYAPDLILLGTLPVIAMAILTDIIMGGLIRAVTPKPMRERAA